MKEKITDFDEKVEILLTAGQLLIENGATNDKIIRVLNRIAVFMKIPEKNFSLQINQQIIFIEIFDGEKTFISFRKCNKNAVDFFIIYSLTKISWKILKESFTLEDLKNFLEFVAEKPKIYSHWQIIFAIGCACGGFCCLFGGNFFEIIYTAICAMTGKFFQIKLLKHKFNEFLSISVAAFIATTLAFLSYSESLKPTIACALFLVPGVPIINAVIDTMNKFFDKALTELFRAFCIILSMTAGIVFSAEICLKFISINFFDFISVKTIPETNVIFVATAAAICAIGFAIPLNIPKKFLYIVGILGASTIFSRYFLWINFNLSQEYATFIAAFIVGYFSIIISKKLNLVSSILMLPPLLPMIPGVLSYRFLFACIELEEMDAENLILILPGGIDILQIIFALVLGANLPRLITRNF